MMISCDDYRYSLSSIYSMTIARLLMVCIYFVWVLYLGQILVKNSSKYTSTRRESDCEGCGLEKAVPHVLLCCFTHLLDGVQQPSTS